MFGATFRANRVGMPVIPNSRHGFVSSQIDAMRPISNTALAVKFIGRIEWGVAFLSHHFARARLAVDKTTTDNYLGDLFARCSPGLCAGLASNVKYIFDGFVFDSRVLAREFRSCSA